MLTTQFEIEMTGITREEAAKAIGDYLVGRVDYRGGSEVEHHIISEEDGQKS